MFRTVTKQMPKTIYVNVNEQVPYTVQEPYNASKTILVDEARSSCTPVTKMVTRRIPVVHVVPQNPPPCPPGPGPNPIGIPVPPGGAFAQRGTLVGKDANYDGVISRNEMGFIPGGGPHPGPFPRPPGPDPMPTGAQPGTPTHRDPGKTRWRFCPARNPGWQGRQLRRSDLPQRDGIHRWWRPPSAPTYAAARTSTHWDPSAPRWRFRPARNTCWKGRQLRRDDYTQRSGIYP